MFILYFLFILNNKNIIIFIMENMILPIIVVNKISKNKWLSKSINFTSFDNKYLMLILSNYMKIWIDSNTDLNRFIDDEKYYDKFTEFIYSEYILPLQTYPYDYIEDEYYEHYNMKYSDDINDIFIYFKDYTKQFGSQLFHGKDDTSYPIVQFVYDICDYVDPYNDDGDLEDSPDIDDMIMENM